MKKIRLFWAFVVAITIFTFLGYLVIMKQQDQLIAPAWELLSRLKTNLKNLPEGDYSRLIDMNDFEFTRDHQGCHQLENRPKIVIMIHSAPDNFAKRKTIRETWGQKDPRSLLLFVIGTFNDTKLEQIIQTEVKSFDDIIQGNFIDAYRNMTYKHTAVLKWFVYNCPDAKFLVKCDDDVFVNTPLLYSFLEKPSPLSKQLHDGNLLFCSRYVHAPIIRDEKSKWYVSPEEYSGNSYSPYCAGFTILYSADVVLELYKAVQVLPYFWIDDVHISGTANLIAKIPYAKTNGLILRNTDQRKDMLDGKIRVEDVPYLFGFYNMGDKDMRKLWDKTECNDSKNKLYCQIIEWISVKNEWSIMFKTKK